MITDCIDICDFVVGVMCKPCPHYAYCQNMEDEANHEQMLDCMRNLEMTKYPIKDDVTPIGCDDE